MSRLALFTPLPLSLLLACAGPATRADSAAPDASHVVKPATDSKPAKAESSSGGTKKKKAAAK